MQIRHLVLGELGTNTYLLIMEDHSLILIDPAESTPEIPHLIESKHLTLESIWLTHGHVDHIKGVQPLLDRYHPTLFCHREEECFLRKPEYNMSMLMGAHLTINYPVHYWSKPVEEIIIGSGLHVKIIHTPGHTPGGVCYYFEEKAVLFSGDTLFMGSIGRTDLPGGSFSQIQSSLDTLKQILPDTCRIFPGHGINTVWLSERKHNPYLTGDMKEME
ncbi:MAG: MBL fold metallo-hydrolase [Candidatus Delongbacteria bacterium]|nr:MBL fold metallo-hydrolase [Candidatus Delongbacteria bacterium]